MDNWTDPRGPERLIVSVEPGTSATLVTLDCGHMNEWNQTMSYRVGDRGRCLKCQRIQAALAAQPARGSRDDDHDYKCDSRRDDGPWMPREEC